MKAVTPKVFDGHVNVVVLERIEPGQEPAYAVHGKVTCDKCDEWCWLGSETFGLVSSGEYHGICRECAARIIPRDMKPVRRAEDDR